MKKSNVYSFDEFKEALVNLAVKDSLPLDLTELSESQLFPPQASAPLIGYQVLAKDGSAGIHPDMDASFCVYSFDQACAMLKGDIMRYEVVPIHEGEIEDPTIMFEGNPND